MVMYQWCGTRLTHGCVIHHSSNIIPSVILWGICCWFALPLGGIAGYTNSVISQDLTTNEEVLRLHALEQLRARYMELTCCHRSLSQMKERYTPYNPSPYSRGCAMNFVYYYCPPHSKPYLNVLESDYEHDDLLLLRASATSERPSLSEDSLASSSSSNAAEEELFGDDDIV